MRVTPVRVMLLVGVVIAALAWRPVTTFLAVDMCLDAGGVYDHAHSRCDHEQSQLAPGGATVSPGVAGTPVIIGGLAIAALIAMFAWHDRRRVGGRVDVTALLFMLAVMLAAPPAVPGQEIQWKISKELRIGSAEGGTPGSFSSISALAVGPDGTIFVLDAPPLQVRSFDRNGV